MSVCAFWLTGWLLPPPGRMAWSGSKIKYVYGVCILINWLVITPTRENNKIRVWNNGKGIPVVEHKTEKMYVPTMIFGHLLTSSNYDDSEKKTTGQYSALHPGKRMGLTSQWRSASLGTLHKASAWLLKLPVPGTGNLKKIRYQRSVSQYSRTLPRPNNVHVFSRDPQKQRSRASPHHSTDTRRSAKQKSSTMKQTLSFQ